MLVIPVLDIRGGVVVHATGGDRARYRPIETPLSPGRSDPVSVVRGYLRLRAFPLFYVADLDGIAGEGRNTAALAALLAAFPDIEVMVDDGRTTWREPAGGGEGLRKHETVRVHPVIGSETLGSVDTLASGDPLAGERTGAIRTALSLDFRGDTFLGPPALLDRADVWPGTVIAMTLGRVGSDRGPDLARVGNLVRRAGPGRRVLAAGGVRGPEDLRELAAAGAAGALVATALHAGKVKAGDLAEIAGPV